ncbi:hypothetical protein PHYSODRAFT_306230 [Phytophthora sojae]|uniref:Uncharacterized protein n=1 Tax=Phytophthora sojae (strain P6497) TaxID=1094619 RepID=G5A8I2_PHYSP|nr:hypothetical protein PHYSODRAFT_306230 [Phytophthora sojae]EGZ08208.1 hypothetical protein PHYSODRAFT_306230 [Phytophthora sojae]|eukprot:XP_009536380.1 hypothetical protein PHYSODRAFT_306230 [Phytophthora sojae]
MPVDIVTVVRVIFFCAARIESTRIEQRWGFLATWCDALKSRVTYTGPERGRSLGTSSVTLPMREEGQDADDEVRFLHEFQKTREAKALLAAAAHMDYDAWRYLLEKNCGVHLGVEGEPLYEEKIPVRYTVMLDHDAQTSILRDFHDLGAHEYDLLFFFGPHQRLHPSAKYRETLQQIAALEQNLHRREAGFDFEVPVRVEFAPPEPSDGVNELVDAGIAEQTLKEQWERFLRSGEDEAAVLGEWRCTFVLERMIGKLGVIDLCEDMGPTIKVLLQQNAWLSLLSVSLNVGVMPSVGSYGRLLSSVFSSTRRPPEIANTSYHPAFSDRPPLQLGEIDFLCASTLRVHDIGAMCSAVAQTQMTRKLTLRLCMDIREQERNRKCWKWLAYALFSKRAQALSSVESLAFAGIRSMSRGLVRFPAWSSAATLSGDSRIRCVLDDLNGSTNTKAITFDVPVPFIRTFSDDGKSTWVDAIVPGYGRCRVQRRDLVFGDVISSNGDVVGRGITSLNLRFYKDAPSVTDGLVLFFGAVGSSLKRLALDAPRDELSSILQCCPSLEELVLTGGVVDAQLPFLRCLPFLAQVNATMPLENMNPRGVVQTFHDCQQPKRLTKPLQARLVVILAIKPSDEHGRAIILFKNHHRFKNPQRCSICPKTPSSWSWQGLPDGLDSQKVHFLKDFYLKLWTFEDTHTLADVDEDLVMFCGTRQLHHDSRPYLQALKDVAALFSCTKPSVDIKIPVRVILSSLEAWRRPGAGLLQVFNAEKRIRQQWEMYDQTLPPQYEGLCLPRCTFVLVPMVLDLTFSSINSEIAKAIETVIHENMWLSQVSLEVQMNQGGHDEWDSDDEDEDDGVSTKSDFGRIMSSLLDSTRRPPPPPPLGLSPLQLKRYLRQLAAIHLECNALLEAREFEAIVVNQTARRLSLRLGMTSWSNGDLAAISGHWWKWIAYAFFSKRARVYSSVEPLALLAVYRRTVKDMENFIFVLESEHPEELVLAKSGCKRKTYGRCQVRRDDLAFVEHYIIEPISSGITSLTIGFDKDQVPISYGLPLLLKAVGYQLKSLTLTGPRVAMSDDVIMQCCPLLEELVRSNYYVDVRLDFREYRAKDKPFHGLNFDWDEITTLSEQLSDVHNPLTTCSETLSEFDHANLIERRLSALLRMLSVNKSLEYLEVVVPPGYERYGDEFYEHHQGPICRPLNPLSAAAKLAFLSVLQSLSPAKK